MWKRRLRDVLDGLIRVAYWEVDRLRSNYHEGYGSGLNPFRKEDRLQMQDAELEVFFSKLIKDDDKTKSIEIVPPHDELH